MTTARLGQQVGYSTQQVRDLERLGVLPPAERAANGYRRYERGHLRALRAYRSLAAALGPVSARRLMPALVTASLGDAAALVDDLHAGLALDRARVTDALRGLDTVLSERNESFEEGDELTIGELARALGVRPSALRHWEHEGLVSADREAPTASRRYGREAIVRARFVAALRSGGYPIPTVRDVLDRLRGGTALDDVRRMLDERRADLARRSVALLAAAGHLHELLHHRSVEE